MGEHDLYAWTIDALAAMLDRKEAETIERCAAEVEDERSRFIFPSASWEASAGCLDRIRGLASTKPEGGK